MNIPQHIIDRLEDYRDGSLDHAGPAELLSWLNDSQENGELLAAWFVSEAELLEAARLADLCAVFEGMPFDARRSAEPKTLQSAQADGSWRLPSFAWMSIAASALVALAAAYYGIQPSGWQSEKGSPAPAGAELALAPQAPESMPPSPAILGRLANCVWADGMQHLRVGQDIAAGTMIKIKAGRAQLVFEHGAEVVLRGPCRFQIDDSMLCRLAFGSVSAEVPPRAAGFTIRGPSSEVIDLGTRFGFSVGAAGESEVHVFQGEVISRQLDDLGRVYGKEIRLKKNQAVLFPGELRQARRLAADEARFAAKVRPLWKRDAIEPLVVDRKLTLWLRAEHGVQTDHANRVIAWQDLAFGENRIANDAFQPNAKARPKHVPEAMRGRAAIRFDGQLTHLTTTPMTTSGDQTIVAVFQYAAPRPDAQRIGGQIINYNGPPSRYLPDIRSPGVLQLGERINPWEGPPWSIAAKAFVGKDSSGADVSAGVVISEPLGHAHPRVVVYAYNNTRNAATLYVDGKLVDRATAPTVVAVTSRKVIGKHGIFDQWYFHGDLSELAIFNTALHPREISQLSRQLMEYYRTAPEDDRSS